MDFLELASKLYYFIAYVTSTFVHDLKKADKAKYLLVFRELILLVLNN